MGERVKPHCIDCLCLNVDCKGHSLTECWTGCVFRRTAEKEVLKSGDITFEELEKLHERLRHKTQPKKPLWIRKRNEFVKNNAARKIAEAPGAD